MSVQAAAAAPAGGIFGPLRGRSFRLLFTGGAASALADQLSLVALAWLSLQLTGSPLTVGGVLTAAAVPRAALMVLGGTFADRLGGQQLAVVTSLVRVAAMGLLAALVLLGLIRLWEVYLLALVFGVADAFYGPARGAMLPRTIAAAQLEAANSLAGITQSLAALLGPALAGLLVARAGTGSALAGDAACFVLVAATTAALRLPPLPGRTSEPTTVLGDAVAGLRYVLGNPALRSLMLVAGAMNFAGSGPVEVGLALLARQRLGGAPGLGLVLAAFGAGSVLGALLAGMLPGGRVRLRLYGTALLLGVLMPLLGVVPDLAPAMVLGGVMGLVAGALGVWISAWVMRRTEPRMMGRMIGVLSLMSFGLIPFSLAAAGAVAEVSLPLLFAGSGALMLLAGLAGLATGGRD